MARMTNSRGKRRALTEAELNQLRKVTCSGHFLVDGVDEDKYGVLISYGNQGTRKFYNKYGIDAVFELAEFIANNPERGYFSPAHDYQTKSGKWVWEEDAWIVARHHPFYNKGTSQKSYMKVYHLWNDQRRTAVVHP